MAVNTEDVLYNLVYVSVASHPLEEQDLVEFLAVTWCLGARPPAALREDGRAWHHARTRSGMKALTEV